MDVCAQGRDRAHEQSCGKKPPPCRAVAQKQLRHPQSSGQSVCRSCPDVGDHLSATGAQCPHQPHGVLSSLLYQERRPLLTSTNKQLTLVRPAVCPVNAYSRVIASYFAPDVIGCGGAHRSVSVSALDSIAAARQRRNCLAEPKDTGLRDLYQVWVCPLGVVCGARDTPHQEDNHCGQQGEYGEATPL